MPDWRLFMDSEFIRAVDLQGKSHIVQIEKVEGGTITGDGGKKSRKPVAHLKGRKKPLALNSTNCKTIASLYGKNTEAWIGKFIEIYPQEGIKFGGNTVEGIRVKPAIPKGTPTSEEPSNG